MDALLSYISFFESVQIICAFGFVVIILAGILTSYQKRVKAMDHVFEAEERREKIKLIDQPKKPPPNSPSHDDY